MNTGTNIKWHDIKFTDEFMDKLNNAIYIYNSEKKDMKAGKRCVDCGWLYKYISDDDNLCIRCAYSNSAYPESVYSLEKCLNECNIHAHVEFQNNNYYINTNAKDLTIIHDGIKAIIDSNENTERILNGKYNGDDKWLYIYNKDKLHIAVPKNDYSILISMCELIIWSDIITIIDKTSEEIAFKKLNENYRVKFNCTNFNGVKYNTMCCVCNEICPYVSIKYGYCVICAFYINGIKHNLTDTLTNYCNDIGPNVEIIKNDLSYTLRFNDSHTFDVINNNFFPDITNDTFNNNNFEDDMSYDDYYYNENYNYANDTYAHKSELLRARCYHYDGNDRWIYKNIYSNNFPPEITIPNKDIKYIIYRLSKLKFLDIFDWSNENDITKHKHLILFDEEYNVKFIGFNNFEVVLFDEE
jgi:hypothetical protein